MKKRLKILLCDVVLISLFATGAWLIRLGWVDPANTDAFYGGAILCCCVFVLWLSSAILLHDGLVRLPLDDLARWVASYKPKREFKDWREELM